MTRTALLTVIPLVLTAACGGSSTGIQNGTTATSGFDEVRLLSEAYIDRFGSVDNPENRVTTAEEMQVSGTAVFTGYMTIASPSLGPTSFAFEHGAKTVVDVDFATGGMTGETGQFYDITDRDNILGSVSYGSEVDGDISFALNGTPAGGNDFFGRVTGTITSGFGTLQIVDQAMGGRIMAPQGDALRAISIDPLNYTIEVYALRD